MVLISLHWASMIVSVLPIFTLIVFLRADVKFALQYPLFHNHPICLKGQYEKISILWESIKMQTYGLPLSR